MGIQNEANKKKIAHLFNPEDDRGAELSECFAQFERLETQFRELDQEQDDDAIERQSELLLERQAELLRVSTSRKAQSVEDAMYKLAIWRWWQGRELQPHANNISLSDSIVYSAFLDLVELFEKPALLHKTDTELAKRLPEQ